MGKIQIVPIRHGEVVLCSKSFILIKLREDNEILLSDVKEMIKLCVQFGENKPYGVMLDGGTTLDIDERGMTYCARYLDDNWKSFAIVVRSLSDRIFANYYLKFKKPIRPTEIFSNSDKATLWMKQFLSFEEPDPNLMYKDED